MYHQLYKMIKVNEETAIIGASELRTEIPNLTKNFVFKKVIITKRGKPIAVLEDYKEHEEKEKLLDEMEDTVLGLMALKREKDPKKKMISLGEMAKSLGIEIK